MKSSRKPKFDKKNYAIKPCETIAWAKRTKIALNINLKRYLRYI